MNINISQSSNKSTNITTPTICYPPSLISYLESITRKDVVVRIINLFDYMFIIAHRTESNRIPLPSQTLESILGTKYNKTLNKISSLVMTDDVYSVTRSECKQYGFTQHFFDYFIKDAPTIIDVINHIKNAVPSLDGQKKLANFKLNEVSNTTNEPNELPLYIVRNFSTEDSESLVEYYSIDLDGYKKFLSTIEPIADDKKRVVYEQIIKNGWRKILSGEIKQTISDKCGRHYDPITQFPREHRKFIVMKGQPYIGDLDLKCCHGFILLNLLKNDIAKDEWVRLYKLFGSRTLWDELQTLANTKDKDSTKRKFQLFINGSIRDNGSNPLYNFFVKDFPSFTEILFKYKSLPDIHLSNQINNIESSIMHSEEVTAYIINNQINCHIIHDGFMLFGAMCEREKYIKLAQFVLRLFKKQYSFDMTFSLELIAGGKTLLSDDFLQQSMMDTLKKLESDYEQLDAERKDIVRRCFRKNVSRRNKPVLWEEYKELVRKQKLITEKKNALLNRNLN